MMLGCDSNDGEPGTGGGVRSGSESQDRKLWGRVCAAHVTHNGAEIAQRDRLVFCSRAHRPIAERRHVDIIDGKGQLQRGRFLGDPSPR